MRNICLFLIALFFIACSGEPGGKTEKDLKEEEAKATVDAKFKLEDDLGFAIKLEKEYTNPDFDVKKLKLANNAGPHNGKTIVKDPEISSMDDLNKYYELPKGYKFAVAIYKKDGTKQPVIVNPEGQLFSFIVESNYLMYDTKLIVDRNGKTFIDWDTQEIKKRK